MKVLLLGAPASWALALQATKPEHVEITVAGRSQIDLCQSGGC